MEIVERFSGVVAVAMVVLAHIAFQPLAKPEPEKGGRGKRLKDSNVFEGIDGGNLSRARCRNGSSSSYCLPTAYFTIFLNNR